MVQLAPSCPQWLGIDVSRPFFMLPGLLITVFSYPGRNPFDVADQPFLPTLLVGSILLLLACYLLAAAILVAAAEGDWKFAFYLNKVSSVAFTKGLSDSRGIVFGPCIGGLWHPVLGRHLDFPSRVGRHVFPCLARWRPWGV